jgi:flagellar protein FlaJ
MVARGVNPFADDVNAPGGLGGDGSFDLFDIASLINTGVYDILLIEFLLVIVILFNALLSSLMIRTTDGGHKMNAYTHFVVLAWIGTIISIATKALVTAFLSV